MSRFYSYIVATDNGSSPNTENGLLSLALCKPKIRSTAKPGDYVIGIAGKNISFYPRRILFIMKITDVSLIADYAVKYPNRKDSIYTAELKQLVNPYHDSAHIKTDIGGKNVLISSDFIYFGNKMIPVPSELSAMVPHGQGHFSKKNDNLKAPILASFIQWKQTYGVGSYGVPNVIHPTFRVAERQLCRN